MKKHVWLVTLVTAVAALLLLYMVAFLVQFDQIAIIKTFGKAGPPIYGSTQAGLHWKLPWPIQSLVRYDARQFLFDDTYEQTQTADKQNILVTIFCTWKIVDAGTVARNNFSAETIEGRLRELVRSAKLQVVGKHRLEHFVNVVPAEMQLATIEQEMLELVRPQAAKEYGVEVVTVAVKAQGLPKTVADKVIENIKEERNREAEAYRSAGAAIAEAIRSRAQAARETILAFAERKAKEIRAEGDRAAAKYYRDFQSDERFAMFLSELDFLRETLKENTVFLLDPSVQHSFSFLKDGPSLPPAAGPGVLAPAKIATTQPAKTAADQKGPP